LDTPEDPSVSVNGLDVSSLLQTPAVTVMASYIGSLNSVSEKLEGMFDQSLVGGNFVAEGKNLSGRIDVPHTRFFLTATRQVRAYRKWMQAQGKGLTNYSLKNAVHDTTMNDFRDTRLVVVNSNTCVIETSTLTPGEVVDKMINYVDSGPGNSHLKTK
jgi:cytidylate kinase